MKTLLKKEPVIVLSALLCFTIFTTGWTQLGEPPSYPSLEEVESEHGYLNLTEEEIVALEESELRQLIIEQDTDGFIEEFSDEYESGTDENPLPVIRQFMNYFFKAMNQRQVILMPDSIPIQNKGMSTTWDLEISNSHIQKIGKKIKLYFTIKFWGLFDRFEPLHPISGNVRLTFHKKRNRWKIKASEGLFPFFTLCIQHIHPQQALPLEFETLVENTEPESREVKK